MNVNTVFPSQYLRASDLGDAEPVVTIARVALEAIGRDKDHKLVIYFEGKSKGLVANKTIAKKLAELTGSPETEDWPGHPIRLYTTTADFGGEAFEVIRVKAAALPRPAAPVPPPKRPAWNAADDAADLTADSIPF
jgi:hypothetical protein